MDIGQAQRIGDSGPPNIGTGLYSVLGQPLTEAVVVTNITTGEVIDRIEPEEFQVKLAFPGGTPRYLYRVQHSKPVTEGDLIAVDAPGGLPDNLWKVVKYVLTGLGIIVWRLEWVKRITEPTPVPVVTAPVAAATIRKKGR